MSFFNARKNRGFDFEIEAAIENRKIMEYKIPFIVRSLSNYLNVRIFKSEQEKETKKLLCLKKFKPLIYDNCIIVHENRDLYLIVFNWNGLLNFIEFLSETPNLITETIMQSLQYETRKCLISLSDNYKNISRNFPNVIIKNDCIELFHEIIPDKYLLENITHDIPKNMRVPIKKLLIYTDPLGFLISVSFSSKHPNSDKNGWYCLGNIKLLPLNIETIELLINQIKRYDLDNCYWKPSWLPSQNK